MSDQVYDGGLGLASRPAGSKALGPAEAMRLLASVDVGRVVFTLNALPAIRPVNYLVEDDSIIIRTRLATSVSRLAASAPSGLVVAFEADELDARTRSGWSVVATGRAYPVDDPDRIERYERLLRPWVNHADTVLAIEPDMVSGLRIL